MISLLYLLLYTPISKLKSHSQSLVKAWYYHSLIHYSLLLLLLFICNILFELIYLFISTKHICFGLEVRTNGYEFFLFSSN